MSPRGFDHAVALLEAGQPAKAMPHLHAHLASNPEDAHAHARLAQGLIELGNYLSAKDAAERSISLDPRNEFPYRLLALACGHVGYRLEAVQAAETAQAVAPNQWETHFVRAQVDILAGTWSHGGRAALGPLLALAPDLASTHTAVAAHLLATETLPQPRDMAVARSHLATALRIAPQDNYALYLLGNLESRSFGRTTKSLIPALDMLAIDPMWSINRGSTLAAANSNLRLLAWVYTVLLVVVSLALYASELMDYGVTTLVTAAIALVGTVAYVVHLARVLGRRALQLVRVLLRISNVFVLRLVILVISLLALLTNPVVPPDLTEWTSFFLPPLLILTGVAAFFDQQRVKQ